METVLNRVMRPSVIFDVNNDQHRRWYAEFLMTSSWGKCPVKFVTAGYGNTKGSIDRQMLEFYIEKEYGKSQN